MKIALSSILLSIGILSLSACGGSSSPNFGAVLGGSTPPL